MSFFTPKNFIAEIGVNHENNIVVAKQMIDECSELGIGCVKFQSYKANKLAAPHSPSYWDNSKEKTKSQIELFSKYDLFSLGEYKEIAEYCTKKNIEFLSTPFDEDYVKVLSPFLKRFKIASVDVTNYLLLESICEQKKPIILSVGASNIDEITDAVNFIRKNGVEDITLLHCVINYPTKIENAGLSNIPFIKGKFPELDIGYSDHTVPEDSHLVLPLAISLGAKVIEKHYTFNKLLPGNDHYHAFDKNDLRVFLMNAKKTIAALQDTNLEIQKNAVLYARRGLYANRNLPKGHIIKKNDLCALRPQLNYISPKNINLIIGKKLNKNIDMLNGLLFEDFD